MLQNFPLPTYGTIVDIALTCKTLWNKKLKPKRSKKVKTGVSGEKLRFKDSVWEAVFLEVGS